MLVEFPMEAWHGWKIYLLYEKFPLISETAHTRDFRIFAKRHAEPDRAMAAAIQMKEG